MIIIGERINSTRKSIQDAIKARNSAFILKEAEGQIKNGAEFIDVNCAMTSGDELQDIDWVISVIQSSIKDFNLCIDSPSHLAINRALETYKGSGSIIINSITAEETRIKNILPLAIERNTKLIALAMDDNGMPSTYSDRIEITKKMVDRVQNQGFNPENLYVDALIRPICTEPEQAKEFLRSIPMIKALGVKTTCGLSNVSFGLPDRKVINSTFLAMAAYAGLDAAILDPMDRNIISSLRASLALIAQDDYCAGYIKAFRDGLLV